VQNALPIPATVDVSVNPHESPLKATLSALLEALRKLSVTDEGLDFMLGKSKTLFETMAASNNLVDTLVNGLPASLSPTLLQGSFAVEDIKNAPKITNSTTGAGIYVQYYEMAGSRRDLLRIGSTNNFWRRASDHRIALDDVTNQGACFHVAIYIACMQSTIRCEVYFLVID